MQGKMKNIIIAILIVAAVILGVLVYQENNKTSPNEIRKTDINSSISEEVEKLKAEQEKEKEAQEELQRQEEEKIKMTVEQDPNV